MSAADGLGAVLSAGGEQLAEGLRDTEQRLAELVHDQGPRLGPHASQTLAAGGKRLRPVLVFLCGGEPSGDLVRAAAAVELLHMATLVHDDVLDGASLRRGRPTVFATAGRDAATATGDLLFSRAFAELAGTGDAAAVRALSAASSSLARGELMQRDDAFDAAVGEPRYFERCRLKTASLFAAACRVGATLGAGVADPVVLSGFGEQIGIAFQVLDDVLDVSGPAQRTGKRRGADLLDGTVTLPLIIARGLDDQLARLDPRDLAGDPDAAEQVCDRIAATGALERSRALALEHVAAAKAEIGRLSLSGERSRALELVADGVVARYA